MKKKTKTTSTYIQCHQRCAAHATERIYIIFVPSPCLSIPLCPSHFQSFSPHITAGRDKTNVTSKNKSGGREKQNVWLLLPKEIFKKQCLHASTQISAASVHVHAHRCRPIVLYPAAKRKKRVGRTHTCPNPTHGLLS